MGWNVGKRVRVLVIWATGAMRRLLPLCHLHSPCLVIVDACCVGCVSVG